MPTPTPDPGTNLPRLWRPREALASIELDQGEGAQVRLSDPDAEQPTPRQEEPWGAWHEQEEWNAT